MTPDLYIDGPVPPAVAVQRQVQAIASRWRDAPSIQVVATAADLPVPAPADARGLCTQDGVWLVAGQPHGTVARTLAHEVVAHHGLRHSLGPAWPAFMGAINSGARASGHLQDVREGVSWAYEGTDLSGHAMADEISAAVAERLAHPRSGQLVAAWPVTKRAVAAWAHARREVLLMEAPASYAELEGALLLSQDRLQHGGRLYGLGRWLSHWYPPAMHKPMGASTPPRDLAESARWLAADQYSRDNWTALKVITWAVAAVGLAGWFLVAIVGMIF